MGLEQRDVNVINQPTVDSSMPATVINDQKTVALAGTAEALGASTTLVRGVMVKALAGNAGNVFVGDSNVSSANGFVLAAGEEVFIAIDDLAKVFIDVGTNGEGVSFIGS